MTVRVDLVEIVVHVRTVRITLPSEAGIDEAAAAELKVISTNPHMIHDGGETRTSAAVVVRGSLGEVSLNSAVNIVDGLAEFVAGPRHEYVNQPFEPPK